MIIKIKLQTKPRQKYYHQWQNAMVLCFFIILFGGHLNDSISLYVTTMEYNKVNVHVQDIVSAQQQQQKTTGNLTNIVLSLMLLSNHI